MGEVLRAVKPSRPNPAHYKGGTFWNGEPAEAHKVWVVIEDDKSLPHFWAREDGLIGKQIPAVEVHYGGHKFYLDDRTGSGWGKVTYGFGAPYYGHREFPNPIEVTVR